MCPYPIYRNTDPQRLIADGTDPSKVKKALAWEYSPRGIVLWGEPGAGKTRISWLIARKLFDSGKKISGFNSVQFAHECARQFLESNGPDWIESIQEADAFLIDDLDKQKLTERVESELYGLIEYFTAHQKPIIATCNSTGDAFLSKFDSKDRGAAIYRRIKEFCHVVNLTRTQPIQISARPTSAPF